MHTYNVVEAFETFTEAENLMNLITKENNWCLSWAINKVEGYYFIQFVSDTELLVNDKYYTFLDNYRIYKVELKEEYTMTISEVIDMKQELEKELTLAILKFEKDTGVKVKYLNYCRDTHRQMNGELQYGEINIEVEVKI